MSNLTDFVGGGIKSIQRGQASGAASITISAVDTAKSFVSSSVYEFSGKGAKVFLTNSTTLTISAPSGAASTAWEVIEYV